MGSAHEARIVAAVTSLDSATAAFLAYLDQLPETMAMATLPGGWTPAGHAAHLTLTNDVFTGAITGAGPLSVFAGTSDFSDAAWHLNAPPTGVGAPSIIVPPAGVTRLAAKSGLLESANRLRAAIASMDSARGATCVRLPWGVVSLDQMAEWGGGHTIRHLAQISRELQIAAMLRGTGVS